MTKSKEEEEQEKALIINRAYLLGLSYVQKAVLESNGDQEKIEKYKDAFFNLCYTALEDLFVASAKPEDRILNLLTEINKERLTLLRYMNDLRNNDASNTGIINELQKYANLSLQTYGQLITAYNNNQQPPALNKFNIAIPFISKNFDISPDNCILKVKNFVLPKEKNTTFVLKIFHEMGSSNSEFFSGSVNKDSVCEAIFSGIEKYKTDERKLPRFKRSKFLFQIIQIKSTTFKKKESSLGEQKLSLQSFDFEYTVNKKFKISDKVTFDVEAMLREPLEKPKETKVDISVRISASASSKVRSATTTSVPEPTIQLTLQPTPTNTEPTNRRSTISPRPGAKTTGNVPRPTVGATRASAGNVPRPTAAAKASAGKSPAKGGSSSQQKKNLAKKLLMNVFPLLPQDELDQFIDTDTIDNFVQSFDDFKAKIIKKGLEMPDEYVNQNQVLQQKKAKLVSDIQSGVISGEDYQALLKKQMDRNISMKEKCTVPMIYSFYCLTSDNMKKQLESFQDDDDDDE